jgi:rubrerythrin
MSFTDVALAILGFLGVVVGSASGILLFVAVVKWLVRGSPASDAEDDESAYPDSLQDAEPAEPTFEEVDTEQPPEGVRMPGARERTRRLLATSDVFHAELLSSVLRDAGIWSFVHGNADAVGATGVPATSLYVAENDLERARQVIDEAEASARQNRMQRQQDFHCPGCGYDVRATRDRCPECGLVL